MAPAGYADFEHVTFDRRRDGVVVVTLNRPEVLNAANARLHREMSEVWAVVDADPDARVSVVTGAGRAFSAGGDLDMIAEMTEDYAAVLEQWRDARTIVEHMLSADKPVVSAINGVAALLWPLLCGMAKAKYYLLTADFITGPEAERIGLVTKCVPDDAVLPEALAVARRLAAGSATAVQWTRRVMNHWLRQALPAFGESVALEMLGFLGPDAREGLAAIRERREPRFPSAPAS
jgi:enoyl-CoA hydratase